MTDLIGAELLETTRENFRQRLSRARRDLHNFMNDKCGLGAAADALATPEFARATETA